MDYIYFLKGSCSSAESEREDMSSAYTNVIGLSLFDFSIHFFFRY